MLCIIHRSDMKNKKRVVARPQPWHFWRRWQLSHCDMIVALPKSNLVLRALFLPTIAVSMMSTASTNVFKRAKLNGNPTSELVIGTHSGKNKNYLLLQCWVLHHAFRSLFDIKALRDRCALKESIQYVWISFCLWKLFSWLLSSLKYLQFSFSIDGILFLF